MNSSKRVLGVIGRSLLIAIAVLFILFSISGIAGTWYVNRVLVNVTNQVFTVVESGVSVANSGVTAALNKVKEARSELAQTEQDINTLGTNLKENHPALVALSERLDTRLAPTVDKIQSVLEPVQEGLAGMDAVLTVANSLPYFQEKAPGLQELQDSLQNLTSLQADVQQLRTTLRAAAEGKADALTDETTALLLQLVQRADDRLARTQDNLQTLLDKIAELQNRIAKKRTEILFMLNMAALLLTLLYLWIIYSQVVVIRVQVGKIRNARKAEEPPSPPDEAPLVLDAQTEDVMSAQYRAVASGEQENLPTNTLEEDAPSSP